MPSPSPGERGAITAELMIGLPILTAVMGVAILGVHAGLLQMRLDDQVALQARYASLGGDVDGVVRDGDLLCVEDSHTFNKGLFALDPLVLSSRSCALDARLGGDESD